ncbi:hypothetical protein C8F04DRAFT_958661, partial [Mycena alexandri]
MRAAKNAYHSAIRREKRAHWREYIVTLPRCNLYKAAKYALNPKASSSSSRTPDLVDANGNVASTPVEKAAFFHSKFFPPTPNAPVLPPTAHPAPHSAPTFTVDHVFKAISKMSPWKAPGPTGIPNVAISSARTIVAPALHHILEAGMRLSYFPRAWRIFITATSRKPGKSDYTTPGAFRPIAEEEGFGKVLESCLADWLSGFAEATGLLSPNQFGG